MESMEMPTQMTSNVSLSVSDSHGTGFESSNEVNTIPSLEQWETVASGDFKSERVQADTTTADMLLTSAKEDGFEKALQNLADGEFEDTQEPDIKQETSDAEVVAGNDSSSEEIVDGTPKIDDVPSEEDKNLLPLREQIGILENKFKTLEEENKSLLERARYLEKANQANQEIMFELAMALHELARQEENEKKKLGLLELAITFLTAFMQYALVPDSGENKTQELNKSKEPKSSNASEKIERLMQIMRERGSQNLQDSQANSAPHIEKPAA